MVTCPGRQKALAKKNSIKSLQDHTEPLKEELGLASIAGPLLLLLIFLNTPGSKETRG